MNFASAVREENTHTFTENGARAKNTTGDDCLNFFSTVGSLRDTDADRKIVLFQNAYHEDPLSALRILFYSRDIRGGLGERDTFREILRYAADRHTSHIKQNLYLIPFYGRWDDLYSLIGTSCEDDMWAFMKKQFENDWIMHCANKDSISLLAKWIRSGNESSQKSRQLGIMTAKKLGYKVYDFKRMVVKLRNHLDIVESKMSTGRWDEINYAHVPSRASMIYRQAFMRHDDSRYLDYIEAVQNGEEKINTGTVYPYDLMHKVIAGQYDATVQAMWDNLPDYVDGRFNAMVIADTSGSMSGRPMETAISLAIYFAQRNRGLYHNLWMTFSMYPKYQEIKGDTLKDIYRNMDTSGWSMNTNLEAALQKILNTAVDNHVAPEYVPASLIIISDMEIDRCERSGWSFYDYMKNEYANAGYTIPNIVFWNVNSRHDVFHADKSRKGVQLVSGQSASTFNTLMRSIGMTPMEYMYSVINSERYQLVQI